MECKHAVLVDEFDNNIGCYQERKKCTLSKQNCQGTEGVCSKFEPMGDVNMNEEENIPDDEEPEETQDEEVPEEEDE